MADILDGSIRDVASALRAHELSATELMEAAVARHEEHDTHLHAYKTFDAEAALEGARAADEKLAAEREPGPLTGIPMSVKDLYGVEGFPTFAGTPRQLPDAWSRDSWLVGRLKQAGAIAVGKTHMVEMAFGGVGYNPNWDTPRNPWDADKHRVPGGSSSGAGVSLWEGSALLALGSDTGGSIRIPAAFTGTVGPRTTRGRWPTDGVVPLSSTFDTVGTLTRTVEDNAYFFGTVDPEWGDPEALLETLAATDIAQVRVAVPKCDMAEACQSDIGDVIQGALDELRTAGAKLMETDGSLIDDAYVLSTGGRPVAATECLHFLKTELPGWLDILHPIVGSRVIHGLTLDDPRYLQALEEHRRLAAAAASLFDGVDVLALPANLITAPEVSELDDLDRYGELNGAILRPTYPVSILGLCGISIPIGLDEAGMPVGLQLVAPGGRDETLLAVALAAERLFGTAVERLGRPPMVGG